MRKMPVKPILAIAGLTLVAGASVAFAADVSLDNISVKTDEPNHKVVIKHVDVKGSNLSADDIKKLLSGELADKDEAALAQKLKADQISIPEIDSISDKGTAKIAAVVLTGVDSGKVAKLDIASADLTALDGSKDGGGHIGAFHAENANFSKLIKASGSAGGGFSGLGLTALSFQGADLQIPLDSEGGAASGKLMHLVVQPLTMSANYDGDFPSKFDVAFQGLTISFPSDSTQGAALKAFGYDSVQVLLHGSSTCDKGAKTCTLSELTIDSPNALSLSLSGTIGNVQTNVDSSDPSAAMTQALSQTLSSVQLKVVNSGLVEKGIAFYAAQKHMQPAAVKAQLAPMTAMIPMMLGDPAVGSKLANALSTFIATPKSLTLVVKAKGAPVPFSDFATLSNPAELLQKVSIDAVANQ